MIIFVTAYVQQHVVLEQRGLLPPLLVSQ